MCCQGGEVGGPDPASLSISQTSKLIGSSATHGHGPDARQEDINHCEPQTQAPRIRYEPACIIIVIIIMILVHGFRQCPFFFCGGERVEEVGREERVVRFSLFSLLLISYLYSSAFICLLMSDFSLKFACFATFGGRCQQNRLTCKLLQPVYSFIFEFTKHIRAG